MTKPRILVVDDDPSFLTAIQLVLQDDYQSVTAAGGQAALDLLENERVSTVLLDLHMPPGMNGLEALQKIRVRHPDLPVVMVTGETDVRHAVDAIKLGAFDYLSKPIDRERLLTTVRNAVDKQTRDRDRANLIEQARLMHPLIGRSPSMVRIRELARKVANSNQPILITGETGTGKDVVARLIHLESGRAGGAFVKINMASLPDELLESELFGHKKGAFTGAFTDKQGLFEQADGGTIFLDEIGLASLRVQAKILHAIENQQFIPIGHTGVVRVDVRVISATNKNLSDEMAGERFLRDLFYRLNGVRIDVPPLRDHAADTVEIAEYFVQLGVAQQGYPNKTLSLGAKQALTDYAWPGNVRELRSIIDRVLLFSDGPYITAEDVQLQIGLPVAAEMEPSDRGLKTFLDERERLFISETLIACDHDVSKAARLLGMHRATLHRKIKALGIEAKQA